MKQTLAIYVTAALACTACGKKSKNDGTPASTPETQIVTGLALAGLNLTQKTDAATPNGFKKSTGLANASDICGTTFPDVSGSRPDGYYACVAAYDVRERFFQAGPTVITKRLESVDDRLNEYVGRLSDNEIPCLDPNHTADRIATVTAGANSEVEATVPAYKLSEFNIATTFSDGHVLDFGRKYYFSCSDKFGSGANFNILLGRKEGTWYLGEIQTIPEGTTSSAPFLKTMMNLDADENMEILFAVAPDALGKSTATNPESGTYSAVTSGVYSKSAGFAQFIVRPKENIIGASALMNTGCEQRLVMNDKAVYVEVNGNNYGNCFSGDIWTADGGYTGPAYSASRVGVKGCLKVSGSTPEPQTDLSLCEEAGLLVATEAGGGQYEDPFARYGIFKLSANIANPPTGGFALRAYHGQRLAPTLGEGTNEMQTIRIPAEAKLVVKDYATISLAFSKSSDSSASDAGTIAAACNAAEASREQTYTQKAEFTVQTFIDTMLSGAEEGTLTTADTVLEQFKAALANTGDAAPKITVRLTRSLGASFRGVGIGTASLKYNGTEIGTATVDQSSLASDKGYTDISVTLTSVPTVDASGKFTLTYSGKTRLVCANSVATTRKVNTHLGLPTFTLYSKPETETPAE